MRKNAQLTIPDHLRSIMLLTGVQIRTVKDQAFGFHAKIYVAGERWGEALWEDSPHGSNYQIMKFVGLGPLLGLDGQVSVSRFSLAAQDLASFLGVPVAAQAGTHVFRFYYPHDEDE